MKLKEIPNNTVVHTPTEAEAEELLAILHEGGYKWCHGKDLSDISIMAGKEAIGINFDNTRKNTIINFWSIETVRRERFTVLTLAEFKERYCEEEKPQPKFKVGDKVKTPLYIGIVTAIKGEKEYEIDGFHLLEERDLELYTEPETKPTEDMETKDYPHYLDRPKTVVETPKKELNLCELLKGHEGETFYSTISGDVKIEDFCDDVMKPIGTTSGRYCRDGKYQSGGIICLYPSRALYEQYPLNAKKAWEVWQEEQGCKCRIWVNYTYSNGKVTAFEVDSIFRNSSERDKCIEEIKAIIEKYSK